MKNSNQIDAMKNEYVAKRFIRVPDVLNRVGFSRTTLYGVLRKATFQTG